MKNKKYKRPHDHEIIQTLLKKKPKYKLNNFIYTR
jgi:hypothetical protein